MASTYTTNLGIEKPGTGEQSGTWGTTANTNYDLIDQAINGIVQVTLAAAGSSGSPNTIDITNGTASDGRNKYIEFVDGGDLGATAYVQLDPNDAEKIVHMRNSLSGSRSVIVFQGTYNASNDFEIPAGKDVVLKFDGGGASATVTQVFVDLKLDALDAATVAATTGNITTVNSTTVDTTNLEVTNLKAKDGTSAGSIADSTGVVTIASAVLTTADINGGAIDGTTLGATTPASVAATTLSTTGDISLPDGAKAIFGAGSDLQIFHDAAGGHSRIDDTGTGNLVLRAAGALVVEKYGGDTMANFANDGAVTLYYDNAAKIGTTATGIDVTGTVTADGLTVDKTATISTSDYYASSTFSGVLKGAATNTKAALLLNSVSSSGQNAFASIHSEPVADYRASLIGTYTADGSGAGYFAINQFSPNASATQERLRIDASGTLKSTVNGAVANLLLENDADTPYMAFTESGAAQFFIGESSIVGGGGGYDIYATSGQGISFFTNALRRVDIDTSGNLLVGGTSAYAQSATTIANGGILYVSRNGGSPATLRRNSDDGAILTLEKDGTTMGSIGTDTSRFKVKSNSLALYLENEGNKQLVWGNVSGVPYFYPQSDNDTNLGYPAQRFKDLYLSGIAYATYVGSSGDTDTIIAFDTANTIRFTTGGSERMRIDSSGNLLVGTTSGGFNGGGLPLVVGGGVGDTGITVFSGASGFGTLNFADEETPLAASYRGVVAYSHTDNFMYFSTNSTERMRLDASGRLGIGVTNPGVGLVVAYGTDGIIGNYYSSSGTNSRISFSNTSLLNNNVSIGSASDALVMYTNNTERMRIDSSGKLGIGKTPTYTIDVKDAGAYGIISIDNTGTTGGGSVAFRQNGAQYGVVGVSGAVLGNTSTNLMVFAETSTSIDFANSGVGTVKFRMSNSNFIVGNGGTFSTSAGCLQIEGDGTIDSGIAGTALTNRMQIYNDNGQVGKIQTTGSSTVYATTSDPRLKSAFTKASGALDMIVEAHDNDYIGVFHFLADPTLTVWGYNAHALVDNQAGFGGTEGTGPRDMTIGDVYEEAVIDEEGNEVTPAKIVQPAGVDPSKRVPLLEAAIYDLLKMNEALTARIEALEGAN